MAMGGSHHKGNNNGSRSTGKPYGLMLLLAFGAALLGVMVLHKLRERRIFSLLVKEKDSQLSSLQLLLQKEREYGKEMKRKNEDVKEKLYSLRTQRMELDRRLFEMQSTIDSLKDEQKAIETALEEKQNEVKMQREQIDASKEILKQKEAEIEDLRHHHDQSNPHVNLTDTSNVAEKDKSDTRSSEETDEELHESAAKFIDGENSTRVDDRSEKSVEDANSWELTVGRLKKPEISQDEGFKNGGGIEGKGIDEVQGERMNVGNSTEQIIDDQGTLLKQRDNSSDVKDGIEHTITRESELERLENSHEDEKQKVRATSKGGMKLEMLDSRTRTRGKHGPMNRTEGKRWRTLAKNRVSKNNGVASMRSRRYYRVDRDELRSRSVGHISNVGIEKVEEKETDENPQEVRKTMDAKLVKASHEDAIMKDREENADPNQKVKQENETWKKSQNSPDRELFMDRSVNDAASSISTYPEKQFSNEVLQQEEEASNFQQKLISWDNYEQENIEEQVTDKRQLTEFIEAADVQESETGATEGGSMEESTAKSNLEEDKEEYKEGTDESEF